MKIKSSQLICKNYARFSLCFLVAIFQNFIFTGAGAQVPLKGTSSGPARSAAQSPVVPTPPSRSPAAAPAEGGVQFKNIYDLCRMRQNEMVAYNNVIVQKSKQLTVERNESEINLAKETLKFARSGLVDVEQSWQRMDCTRIIYGGFRDPSR
jgi:hypothetical protein